MKFMIHDKLIHFFFQLNNKSLGERRKKGLKVESN